MGIYKFQLFVEQISLLILPVFVVTALKQHPGALPVVVIVLLKQFKFIKVLLPGVKPPQVLLLLRQTQTVLPLNVIVIPLFLDQRGDAGGVVIDLS